MKELRKKIFISSSCFNHFLFKEDIPDKILDSINGIEFSGGYKYIPEREVIEYLDQFCKKHDILIHNYFPVPEDSFLLNIASNDQNINRKSINFIKKAINICSMYKVPYYSFHTGYLYDGYEDYKGHLKFLKNQDISYSEGLDRLIDKLNHLNLFARKNNVKLALENVFKEPGDLNSPLNCTFQNIEDIFSNIPEDIGLLLDLGHLNITSYYMNIDKYNFLDKILNKYHNRIVEIHLSTNNGRFDQHLPIEKNDWQLNVLKDLFANDKMINTTLEIRTNDINELYESLSLVKDKLQ